MRQVCYGLLWISGFCGLVYEVCWAREIGLAIGHGERGAAVTLALFFAGMAGGSALAERALTRFPWRTWGVLELVVALSALLLPHWARGLGLDGTNLTILLLPTGAMGASLPFAVQAAQHSGLKPSQAYASHLVGAAAGSLAATFAGIDSLGVWGSTQAAAALSSAAALLAFTLPAAPRSACPPPSPVPNAPGLTLAAGLSGMATIGLEVLALRLFALTFHNSTHTLGLTVSMFIVFLAVGSHIAGRHPSLAAQATRARAARIAWLAALGTLLLVPLFAGITQFGELRAPSFPSYVALATGLVAMVLIWPVSAAGALLPALWRVSDSPAGRAVSRLGAANNLGAACGALLVSFVALPATGLFNAILGVATCYAALFVWLAGPSRRVLFPLCALAVAAGAARISAPGTPDGARLRARWQSSYGWLDLVELPGSAGLGARLDLHYQLGASPDRDRHHRMGALPLALFGRPRRALFIGLATGMTASAALELPSLRGIDIVELIPDMLSLARQFAAFNGRLLDDPRVRVTLDDARSYLGRSVGPFDVIVSDLFVPWHSHAGYLYTVEHFQTVRARLSPHGLFAQWLPLYQLGAMELDLILNSLLMVFPHHSIWLDDSDPTRALLAVAGYRGPPSTAPSELLGVRRLEDWSPASAAGLNTDEHPRVEFSAPRTERDQRLLIGATLRAYLARRVGNSARRY